jgi:hypothetical protein
MNQERRDSALRKALTFSSSIDELKNSLSQLDWDEEKVTVTLQFSHVARVLARYVEKGLSTNDIEVWANLIESREDIGFDARNETAIAEIIYELANPVLTQELTLRRADELLQICGVAC